MLPLRTVISQISRFGGSTWKEPTPQLTGAVLHEVINGQTHLAKGGAPLRQALVPICHFGSRAGSQGQEHLLAREHELSSCPLGARGLLWSAGYVSVTTQVRGKPRRCSCSLGSTDLNPESQKRVLLFRTAGCRYSQHLLCPNEWVLGSLETQLML